MNIMQSKTVKFIMQLRNYVTRRKGEWRNTNKRSIQISDNQPAYIRQVPVAMLQQMFEVTAKFDHRRWNPESVVCYHAMRRTPERSLAHAR